MDPGSIIALAAPIVEFLVNVFGMSRAEAEREAVKRVQEDAYKYTTDIKPPTLEEAKLFEQSPAELSKFTEDARLKAAQMKALEGLGREVEYEGMTPEDFAAVQRAQAQAGSVEAGLRGAAQREMAQRGATSSTAGYLGAISAAQAGTNRAADMQMQAAEDSRRRYMAALEGLGGLGGQVRGQEFGMASERASAQDAINRFNVGQKTATQQYNLGLAQQGFENQLRLAEARRAAAAQRAGAGKQSAEDAEKSAQKWGAAGAGLMKGYGSYASGAGGGGGGPTGGY